MYGVISSTTRKLKKLYGSISSTTREIKKVYGVVGGVTRLIFSDGLVETKWSGVLYKSNTSDDYYGSLRILKRTKGSLSVNWNTNISDNSPYVDAVVVSEDGVWCCCVSYSYLTFFKYDGTTMVQTTKLNKTDVINLSGLSGNNSYQKCGLNSDGSVFFISLNVGSNTSSYRTVLLFYKNTEGTLSYLSSCVLAQTVIPSSYPTSSGYTSFAIDLKWNYIALGAYFYENSYPYECIVRKILKLNKDFTVTSLFENSYYFNRDYDFEDGDKNGYIDPNGRYAIIGLKDLEDVGSDYDYYHAQSLYYLNNNTVTKSSDNLLNNSRLRKYETPFSSSDGKNLYIQEDSGSGAYSSSLVCYSCSGATITKLGSINIGNYVSRLKELFTDDIHGFINYASTENDSNFYRYFVTFSKDSTGLFTAYTRSGTSCGSDDTAYAFVDREY